MRAVWPAVTVAVVAVVLLEVLVRVGVVRAFVTPPPSAVLRVLATEADVWRAAGVTAASALAALALSAGVGTTLAAVLAVSGLARRAVYPYVVMLQTVPIVAVAPLLAIWFALTPTTNVVCGFVASVFPVVAAGVAGMTSVSPDLLDLFRLHRASRLTTLLKLRLPAALPQLVVGYRIAAALAAIGTVVGEFITNLGLGGLLNVSRQAQRVDKVYALLVLATLLGLLLYGLVQLASTVFLRRRAPAE